MASQFYEVERIVASRKKGTKLEYLVLWTDYPKEQASWVRHKDVTPALLRSFVNPTPSIRVVLDCVSVFMHHVGSSLSAGTIRRNQLRIDMPSDVFRFLFDGKGKSVGQGYKEYELCEFDDKYFTNDWYASYDANGDGCAIDFPLRMKSSVSWSRSQRFMKNKELVKKIYFERVYIYVVKKRI